MLRRGPTAHRPLLSRWIHTVNPISAFVQQSPWLAEKQRTASPPAMPAAMRARLRGISGPVPPRNQRGLSWLRYHPWPDRSASGPWRYSCDPSIRRRSGSWRGPRKPRQRTRCTMQVWTVSLRIGRVDSVREALEAVHCPAVICLQSQSIRIGKAGYPFHFRPSRSNAFAMTMSVRMTAVMAGFLHFPVDTSCSYLALGSGLHRVATTAGK
jgi:hypothetical protein